MTETSKARPDAPPYVTSLKARIRNQAANELLATQLERTIALVVVGQMLLIADEGSGAGTGAVGAIKGGTAMRVRFGPGNSRFSRDFDTARGEDLSAFIDRLSGALLAGWSGFTGEIRRSRSVARPRNVPEQYVMVAYEVKLRFGTMGQPKPFLTIPIEIGADELGETLDPPRFLDSKITEIFAALGLQQPRPVPVIPDEHQIAQKLHAVSGSGSERAHDLIDLQLLARATTSTDEQIAVTCARLFAFRRQQTWPPVVAEGPNWASLYEAQCGGLDVLPDVAEAVVWANGYITRLATASSDCQHFEVCMDSNSEDPRS